MKLYKFASVPLALVYTALSAQSVFALDIKFSSSVHQAKVMSACNAAAVKLQTKAPPSLCNTINVVSLVTDMENDVYDLLGTSNEHLPFHAYIEAREGGASKYTLEAMRENMPDRFPNNVWIAPPVDRYLDLANLDSISIKYELVRTDFGIHRTMKKYKFYTMGLFSGNEKNATYQVENLAVDLHFRYTVRHNGQIIYDGFIEHFDTLSSAITCKDSQGSTERRGCEEGVGEQLTLNKVNENFSSTFLTAALLARNDSVFSEMTPYARNDNRINDDIGDPKFTPPPSNIATRENLQTYASSFVVVEGGRASFKFKQMPLYVSAKPTAQINSGGSGRATANFLSDQQSCASWARSSVKQDRATRNTAGWLANMAGLGDLSTAINIASSAATMAENMTGEELRLANECMRGKGHAGIRKAMASDAAASGGYAPYTAKARVPNTVAVQNSYSQRSSELASHTQTTPPANIGSASNVTSGAMQIAVNNLGLSVENSATSGIAPSILPKVDNPVGVLDSIDMDFGYAIMTADKSLSIGGIVKVPLQSGGEASLRVSKNNGENKYSLIPIDPNQLSLLRSGYPIGQ